MAFNAKELFGQKAFSDITISNEQGLHIPCHKIILSSASPYFKTLCSDPQTKLTLQNDSPGALQVVLAWIYGHDYATLSHNQPLPFHLEILTTAQKYHLHALETQAALAFCDALPDEMEVVQLQNLLEHISAFPTPNEDVNDAMASLAIKHAARVVSEKGLRALLEGNERFWRYVCMELRLAETLERDP